MEKNIQSVSVMEQCVVTPASPPTADIHAPLSFLDMPWMYFNNIQRLLFYKIPNLTRSQFLGHIFPNLKQSLSLALDHFPFVAGNLIIPPNTNSSLPEICFRNGDGVTLICAECDNIDFNHLVGNDERDCNEFYPLVPQLEASGLNKLDSLSSDHYEVSTTGPVLTLQVTFFPGIGLSVGISNHHALGDARSIFMFMKTWSIYSYKLSHDKIVSESQLVLELPVFDKSLIQDNNGLAKTICDQFMNLYSSSQANPFPKSTQKTSKVRKTFMVSPEDVKKLKILVSDSITVRASSFVVVCSYIWTCLVKSRQNEDEHRESILVAVDCRERTDPPIPANYFGNCLSNCFTGLGGNELAGECGFGKACELLGRSISEKFNRNDEVFYVEEGFMEKMDWAHCQTVSGSTRQNYYSLNFGWGNAVKFEIISIDSNSSVSLSGCRDSDGGVEVGLALTESQMNAFSSIFTEGLNL